MKVERVADTAKRCYLDACGSVEIAMRDDRMQQAADGRTSINNRFVYDDIRQRAARSVEMSRKEALEAIEAARKRATDALTEAPTNEEANYILSISGRDDLTENEIAAALNRYSSHAAQRAIVAAANRSGKKLIVPSGMTEAEREISLLDDLENRVNDNFSLDKIANTSEGGRFVIGNSFTATVAGDSLKEQFSALLNG